MGHHPSYFTSFAGAFAQSGANVVPFCIDPCDFLRRLDNLNLSLEIRRRINKPELITPPSLSSFRPARFRLQYQAISFFASLGFKLRLWERSNSTSISLAFFSCIYDHDFQHFNLAQHLFRFPWSGLYLHARSFRMPGSPMPYVGIMPCPERIFSSSWITSIAVLDEGAVSPLSKIIGDNKVIVFPDFTDNSDSQFPSDDGLARKIISFADGKPVVCLIGHLQWTKGLELFTSAAAHPDLQDVFFFLGGELNWLQIPSDIQKILRRQWETLPNFYGHFQQIVSDTTLNAIIHSSSCVFAAYKSFPNSSNILTRSALLDRPIIVSDGYLMAERVRSYNLGEVIPEGDLGALVSAIRSILSPAYQSRVNVGASRSDYNYAHSKERLPLAFKRVLQSLP